MEQSSNRDAFQLDLLNQDFLTKEDQMYWHNLAMNLLVDFRWRILKHKIKSFTMADFAQWAYVRNLKRPVTALPFRRVFAHAVKQKYIEHLHQEYYKPIL